MKSLFNGGKLILQRFPTELLTIQINWQLMIGIGLLRFLPKDLLGSLRVGPGMEIQLKSLSGLKLSMSNGLSISLRLILASGTSISSSWISTSGTWIEPYSAPSGKPLTSSWSWTNRICDSSLVLVPWIHKVLKLYLCRAKEKHPPTNNHRTCRLVFQYRMVLLPAWWWYGIVSETFILNYIKIEFVNLFIQIRSLRMRKKISFLFPPKLWFNPEKIESLCRKDGLRGLPLN